jgi:acyl-coenzyme A synthetase/AMP-(fatty) acid ligase/thioesterase domain-containing protein/acyl carrier protein
VNSSGSVGVEEPLTLATALAGVVAAGPDREAVTDRDRSLTFGELEGRTAAVAHRLQELMDDVESPGRPVGGTRWVPVIVDRTAGSVVGLQAAARAGIAFSPIESDLPADRLAELFHRLGDPPVALVSRAEHLALLPAGVHGVDVMDDRLGGRGEIVDVDPSAPGVVLFTSGSTGRPKAVVRPWVNFTRSMVSERSRTPGIGSRRTSQLRPFSFGAGLARLSRVSLGDSVHLLDPREIDPGELLELMGELQLTDLHLGASLMAALIRGSSGRTRLLSVDVVRLGGEPTPWDLIPSVFDLVASDASVQVGFAATEAGNMTQFIVRSGDPIGEGFIALGRPVRPEMFRLAEVEGIDAAGEILIGDPYACGYLDDPELDAARFTIDVDGVRWWHSGDLASVDVDGVFHHRGRIDDMVKINGMLVEPREVEVAIRSIDGITDVAVVPRVAANGATRLVAHLLVDDESLTPEHVRQQLVARLPAPMVPAMFVRHARFPLTDRSKLDRASLAGGSWERWRSSSPRTGHLEQELWLASQVEIILDLGEVGFDDDIWDLGLDSLGAVELCAAIADAGFGEIDPNQLLETRTVGSLVTLLISRECGPGSAAVTMNPSGTRRPAFAIPGGGGTALRFQALAQCLGGDQPVVVIEPRGMHCVGRVDRTVESIATHALGEIETRLDPGERCVLLGFSAGATIAFEIAHQLWARGRAVELLLLDAVPGGGRFSRELASPVVIEERPGFLQRVRRRGPVATARRFPVLLTTRRRLRRMERFERDPGPPSHDLDRYLAFRRIQREAIRAYRPAPVPLAATLVRTSDNPIEGLVEQFFTELRVVEVGGDHDTMLMHPHVSAIADLVAAAVTVASAAPEPFPGPRI